jgi:hypothetical protein
MSLNQFLFKIELDPKGHVVELDNMTLDATEAFLKITESIVSLLNEYKNNSGKENIRINIYKSSAACLANFDQETFSEFEQDFQAVRNNVLEDQTKFKKFRRLQDHISREEFRMSTSFISSGRYENVISIFRGVKFKSVKQESIRRLPICQFEKVYLNRIGGDTAHVEVVFNRNEDEVKRENIRVKDIDLALGLKGYLYQEVYLLISLDNRFKKEIVDIYKDETELLVYKSWVDNIQTLDGVDRYKALTERIRFVLGNETDLKQRHELLFKHCIPFLHKKVEPGMIRTILMILKPFKQDFILGEMFNSFVDLYNKTTRRRID